MTPELVPRTTDELRFNLLVHSRDEIEMTHISRSTAEWATAVLLHPDADTRKAKYMSAFSGDGGPYNVVTNATNPMFTDPIQKQVDGIASLHPYAHSPAGKTDLRPPCSSEATNIC
jgi:hypothetical protein